MATDTTSQTDLTVAYVPNTLMAFVDVLGFVPWLESKSLQEIVETMNDILSFDNSAEYSEMACIQTKLISDSLIVWSSITEARQLTAFFVYLGTVIAKIHHRGGVIVRGTIACGDHYYERDLWISPVFVEAYKAESKVRGAPPRVVLLDSAKRRLRELDESILSGDSWLTEDHDDQSLYVNYLLFSDEAYRPAVNRITLDLQTAEAVSSRANLEAHRDMITKGLLGDEAHRPKYVWLANYHNRYVAKSVSIARTAALQVNLPLRDRGD